jgi:hypothetical protein
MITKLEVSSETENEMDGQLEIDIENVQEWITSYGYDGLHSAFGHNFIEFFDDDKKDWILSYLDKVELIGVKSVTCFKTFKPMRVVDFKLTFNLSNLKITTDNLKIFEALRYDGVNQKIILNRHECSRKIGKLFDDEIKKMKAQ